MTTSQYIDVNKKAYDLLAGQYLSRMHNKSKHEKSIDLLAGIPMRMAKDRFGQVSVLELGPGSGEVSRYFSENGCKTTAVDISDKVLDVVRQVSPKTKIIHANALDYQFPANEFELVYCGAILHLFKKADAAVLLSQINSTLKPTAFLFANTTINEKSSEGYYEKNDYCGDVKRFRHKYTEDEFKSLIESAGFEILRRGFTDEKNRDKKWVSFTSEKRI